MKPLTRLVLVLFTLAASYHLLSAANYNWSGSSGSDLFWLTPANWSPSGPPGTSDDAIFTDLGSTNGTKLNGVKISADIVLRVGDQLSVGKTTFTYEDEQKKVEPTASKSEDALLAGGAGRAVAAG